MKDTEPAGQIEPGRILKVGMECDFAPYNWEESKPSTTNLPLSNNKGFYAEGYDVQIARALAGHIGTKIEVSKIAWGDLLPALKDGKIDLIISGMADIPERLALPDFSASPTYNPNVAEYSIMVKRDSRYVDATTLADFYGARVVAQKGTKLDSVIDQIPNVNHLPPTETVSQMFEVLEKNEADAVVINTESAPIYMAEYPSLAFVRFSKGQGFKLDFTGICVWTRREDKSLQKAVEKALSNISAETRKELLDGAEKKSDA